MDLQHMVDAEISAGRNDSALKLIDEAKATVTLDTEAQIKRGSILRDLGRTRESIEHFLDMHHENPNNIRVLHQLAISQRMTGDTDASDSSLNAILALQPKHRGALLGKIHNSEKKADHQQALERAKYALDIHPTDIALSVRYGVSLKNAGLLKESTTYFESLLVKHHNNVDILLELSRNRIMQRSYSAAQSLLENALHADPGNRTAISLRIECATLSGQLMHAIQFAQDAMLQTGNDCQIAIRLARLYRTVGWPEMAIGVLDSLPKHINDNTQSLLIRADSYADMELFEQAISLYHAVLSEHPQVPNAILKSIDLALHGYGVKSPRTILDDLRRCLSKSKNTTRSAHLMLEATARAGDWSGLLELCQSEHPTQPESQNFYIFFTALSQFGSGDVKSAKSNISRFIGLNPDDFPGKMLLADIELSLGNCGASLAIRKEVASTVGLPQQNALLLHALDLFRVGKSSEAHKLFTSLKNLDGYFPSTNYIDELLKQGSAMEAADCLKKTNALRERLPLPAQPHLQLATEPLAQPLNNSFIDQSHLKVLFDFDNGHELFGKNVNPAAFLAWRLTKGMHGDYQAWSRRALQATLACKILHRTPARNEDLEKFSAPPDLTPIETLIRDGRSFILASTHMGPAVGTYLTRKIPNIMYFQNMTISKSVETVGAMGIATAGKSQEAAIVAVTALRRGKILSATPDVDILRLTRGKAPPMAKATARLFGVEIEISNMIPKLSRELKVPSYWFQPQWKDGKIHFSIEPLPLAETNEDPVVWNNRWAQAYLTKLEELMISEPENQNLNAAPWRYLLYYAQESALLAPLLK